MSAYARVLPEYRRAGWPGVLPLPSRAKKAPPEGFTGGDGAWPDEADFARWSKRSGWDNVALRLPLGVVGIDVDLHKGAEYVEAWAEFCAGLSPLPPTVMSSARSDGSGIRLYRAPEVTFRGRFPWGEVVQHHHRYALVWPSLNPHADGAVYQWRDSVTLAPIVDMFENFVPTLAELPELPADWVEALSAPESPAEVAEVIELGRARLPVLTGRMAPAVEKSVARALGGMVKGSRHDTMVEAAASFVRLAQAEFDGAEEGWQVVRSAFVQAVAGERDGEKEADQAWCDAEAKFPLSTNPIPTKAERVAEYRARDDQALRSLVPSTVTAREVRTTTVEQSVEVVQLRPREPGFRTPTPGGEFLFRVEYDAPPVWGTPEACVWPSGEPFYICGPTGVGKTTLAVQIVGGLAGMWPEVLGMPIAPTEGNIIYVAADRPRQFRRAALRVFGPEHAEILDARLLVHEGPPLKYLNDDPLGLLEYAQDHGATVIVLDSLKDVAAKLVEDASGQALNAAVQHCVANGIDVAGLHHYRKRMQGEGRKPTSVDEVYGSTWITAGAGSVVQLWGQPGAAEIEWNHLKQPTGEVGPFRIDHDAETGRMTLVGESDLLSMLRAHRGPGITAMDVVRRIYGKSDDTAKEADRKKASRQLDALVTAGHAVKILGGDGGSGGSRPNVWRPSTSLLTADGAPDT